MPIFSDVGFTSFLVYPTRGKSALAASARNVLLAIKNDSTIRIGGDNLPAVQFMAQRLKDWVSRTAALAECFAPMSIAIPVPRNTPLPTGALWPALRICEELKRVGLVDEVAPVLCRRRHVKRSSTSGSMARLDQQAHYDTLEVLGGRTQFAAGIRFLLVDDLVTRGATFLGAQARIIEAFPSCTIQGFAVGRTLSQGEPGSIADPVRGRCFVIDGQPHREP